ncbi:MULTISPECIES: peptide IlvX [Citrobacter]
MNNSIKFCFFIFMTGN